MNKYFENLKNILSQIKNKDDVKGSIKYGENDLNYEKKKITEIDGKPVYNYFITINNKKYDIQEILDSMITGGMDSMVFDKTLYDNTVEFLNLTNLTKSDEKEDIKHNIELLLNEQKESWMNTPMYSTYKVQFLNQILDKEPRLLETLQKKGFLVKPTESNILGLVDRFNQYVGSSALAYRNYTTIAALATSATTAVVELTNILLGIGTSKEKEVIEITNELVITATNGCYLYNSLTNTTTLIRLLSCRNGKDLKKGNQVTETCDIQDALIQKCPSDTFNPCLKSGNSSDCSLYLVSDESEADDKKTFLACSTSEQKDCSQFCDSKYFNMGPEYNISCIGLKGNEGVLFLLNELKVFDKVDLTNLPTKKSKMLILTDKHTKVLYLVNIILLGICIFAYIKKFR